MKSGFCGGIRIRPRMILPPPSEKPLVNDASESWPGMKSPDRGVAGLPTLFGGPFADRVALLPQREATADIGEIRGICTRPRR